MDHNLRSRNLIKFTKATIFNHFRVYHKLITLLTHTYTYLDAFQVTYLLLFCKIKSTICNVLPSSCSIAKWRAFSSFSCQIQCKYLKHKGLAYSWHENIWRFWECEFNIYKISKKYLIHQVLTYIVTWLIYAYLCCSVLICFIQH